MDLDTAKVIKIHYRTNVFLPGINTKFSSFMEKTKNPAGVKRGGIR